MTTQHTPGPWVAVELPTAIAIKSHMGNVANIQRGSMREQQQANARLIAAAPDLLEALKLAHGALCQAASDVADWGAYAPEHFSKKHRLADDVQAYVNAANSTMVAIAKAEGKA